MKNARTTEAVTSAKFHADDIPLHDAQQDLFPVEFEVRKRLANPSPQSSLDRGR